jgi:hypothetical protein
MSSIAACFGFFSTGMYCSTKRSMNRMFERELGGHRKSQWVNHSYRQFSVGVLSSLSIMTFSSLSLVFVKCKPSGARESFIYTACDSPNVLSGCGLFALRE